MLIMLTLEERVEIILLCGRENWSQRTVTAEFNIRHPNRQVQQSTVSRLLNKFKETGSVADLPRSGRPSTSADVHDTVIGKFCTSPKKSVRRASFELNVPKSTIHDILKKERFHPYKLQILHHLNEDDPDRRIQMCEWFLEQIAEDDDFLLNVLFSDEANFYVNGEVNKQNLRYWSPENPHWFSGDKQQGAQRIMVWCGICNGQVIGPFFFSDTVNGETYLKMLENKLTSALSILNGRTIWFMQDGAPAHYATSVREWLNVNFPYKWIGRRGPVEWAPRSPDLNPLDFAFWGYLKAQVYKVKIRDLHHLQERIESECRNIDPDMLHRVVGNMNLRLQKCIELGGQHIEHVL